MHSGVNIDLQRTLDTWAQRVRDNQPRTIYEIFPGENAIAVAYRAQCQRLLQLGYLEPAWDDGLRPDQRILNPFLPYRRTTPTSAGDVAPGAAPMPGGRMTPDAQAQLPSAPSMPTAPYQSNAWGGWDRSASNRLPSQQRQAPTAPPSLSAPPPSYRSLPEDYPTHPSLPSLKTDRPTLAADLWARFEPQIIVGYAADFDTYTIQFDRCHLATADDVIAAFGVLTGKMERALSMHGRQRGALLVDISALQIGSGEVLHRWGTSLKQFLEDHCVQPEPGRYLIVRYSAPTPTSRDNVAARGIGSSSGSSPTVNSVMTRIQVMTEAATQGFQSNIYSSAEEALAVLMVLRRRYYSTFPAPNPNVERR